MKWMNPLRMKRVGIMGMNCRNIDFIGKYNSRKLYPLVDDKLKTKLLAHEHGLAMPPLRFVIRWQHEIRHVDDRLENMDGFAIKPTRGSGGKGILIVTGHQDGRFTKASGKGAVGLPVWLWVENQTPLSFGPYIESATLGGVTVTATARVALGQAQAAQAARARAGSSPAAAAAAASRQGLRSRACRSWAWASWRWGDAAGSADAQRQVAT